MTDKPHNMAFDQATVYPTIYSNKFLFLASMNLPLVTEVAERLFQLEKCCAELIDDSSCEVSEEEEGGKFSCFANNKRLISISLAELKNKRMNIGGAVFSGAEMMKKWIEKVDEVMLNSSSESIDNNYNENYAPMPQYYQRGGGFQNSVYPYDAVSHIPRYGSMYDDAPLPPQRLMPSSTTQYGEEDLYFASGGSSSGRGMSWRGERGRNEQYHMLQPRGYCGEDRSQRLYGSDTVPFNSSNDAFNSVSTARKTGVVLGGAEGPFDIQEMIIAKPKHEMERQKKRKMSGVTTEEDDSKFLTSSNTNTSSPKSVGIPVVNSSVRTADHCSGEGAYGVQEYSQRDMVSHASCAPPPSTDNISSGTLNKVVSEDNTANNDIDSMGTYALSSVRMVSMTEEERKDEMGRTHSYYETKTSSKPNTPELRRVSKGEGSKDGGSGDNDASGSVSQINPVAVATLASLASMVSKDELKPEALNGYPNSQSLPVSPSDTSKPTQKTFSMIDVKEEDFQEGDASNGASSSSSSSIPSTSYWPSLSSFYDSNKGKTEMEADGEAVDQKMLEAKRAKLASNYHRNSSGGFMVRKKIGGTSEFCGVSWDAGRNRWRIQLRTKCSRQICKYFKSEIEAAQEHDRLVRFHKLTNKSLNFPTEEEIMSGEYLKTRNYIGLSWQEPRKKWMVQITINGKTQWIGRFTNEIEAAKAYDAVAKDHSDKILNFPEDYPEHRYVKAPSSRSGAPFGKLDQHSLHLKQQKRISPPPQPASLGASYPYSNHQFHYRPRQHINASNGEGGGRRGFDMPQYTSFNAKYGSSGLSEPGEASGESGRSSHPGLLSQTRNSMLPSSSMSHQQTPYNHFPRPLPSQQRHPDFMHHISYHQDPFMFRGQPQGYHQHLPSYQYQQQQQLHSMNYAMHSTTAPQQYGYTTPQQYGCMPHQNTSPMAYPAPHNYAQQHSVLIADNYQPIPSQQRQDNPSSVQQSAGLSGLPTNLHNTIHVADGASSSSNQVITTTGVCNGEPGKEESILASVPKKDTVGVEEDSAHLEALNKRLNLQQQSLEQLTSRLLVEQQAALRFQPSSSTAETSEMPSSSV